MFLSIVYMKWIPNVHLLGLLIASFTLVYRVYALIPLYVFIMLYGVFLGFSPFWIPHLYIWLPLWGIFMIFGKFNPSTKIKAPIAMTLCALHGFSYGILYAPFQAYWFGLSFQGMIAWIIAGIPFDIIHGVGNMVTGTLIVPLVALLKKLDTSNVF